MKTQVGGNFRTMRVQIAGPDQYRVSNNWLDYKFVEDQQQNGDRLNFNEFRSLFNVSITST